MPRRKWKKLGARRPNPFISDELMLQIRNGETTLPEVMAAKLPSLAEQAYWRVERERAESEAAKAKRMARRAARDDPDKRAREAAAFQSRQDAIERKKAARLARLERDAAAKAAELAANPTTNWRTPRRPNWQPPADYQSGGKRQNKRRAGSPDRSTPG